MCSAVRRDPRRYNMENIQKELILKRPPRIVGRDFSDEDILAAHQSNRLLRLTVEIARNVCPLRCIYCYANAGTEEPDTLQVNQIIRIIDEAVDLGARCIVLTGGGEPLTLKSDFKRIVEHISPKENGGNPVIPLVFTNGILMDSDCAKMLFENNATVITKLNAVDRSEVADKLEGWLGAQKSLRPASEVVDNLCGSDSKRKTYEKMRTAIDILVKAGYGDVDPERPRLGVESVITKLNYDYIEPLWHFIRSLHLFPYVELTKLMGRARFEDHVKHNRVTKEEAKQLFERIAYVDRIDYGYQWEPLPPIMADRCALYYYSCYVNMDGHVQPCSGVSANIANGEVLQPGGLARVLQSMAFNSDVRKVNELLKGKCGMCALSKRPVGCYGCRSHAYWDDDHKGEPICDWLRADPMCWRLDDGNGAVDKKRS